jgi:cell division transport system permease protein
MKALGMILRQAGRNYRQTWGTQLMTLLTVVLSVLIFSFFFLVYMNMLRASDRLGDDIRLIVYLDSEPVPELRPQIERKIREFSEVEKIVLPNSSATTGTCWPTSAPAFCRLPSRSSPRRP